ncbi:MAG: S9 family peptidase [Flammeovirgaceae bacterium]|nr:MAG: S9 family peptidase [Flammeovirgaceae bacterium]
MRPVPFLLLCSVVAFAQSAWTPAEMMKFKRLTSAVISPDGKRVAYTVSVPLMEGDKSEFLTHIWVASTDGSMNRQFTFGDKSCSNPQFSPDSRWLAFISSRGSDRTQLHVISLEGGEAEQVTNQKNNVGQFAWSPDGKRIAFTMTDPLTEQEEKNRKEKRDMEIADTYKNAHIYTVSLAKDARGKYPVKRLSGGDFHVTDLTWSPDGKTIAFAHQINASLNEWPTTDISTIPADSGAVKKLVANKGQDANPVYSPDGQWLAFFSGGDVVSWSGANDVYIVPATGGTPKKLAPTFDGSFQILSWAADGKSIFISEAYRTTRVVYSLPVDGKPAKIITPAEGMHTNATFNKATDQMACIYQNSSVPANVYVMSLKDMKLRKISSINDDFAAKPHAKTEVISWKSKDGKYIIDGLLTYPANYQAGRKYPLILNIHGGPAGVFTQNYTGASTIYPLQAFASEGYAVLRPNPRGSSGYGVEFRQANKNDWGFGDYDDIMAGVDKVIADGLVHPDSLCVTGWSYGGYMTSMIITKTNRFKAAMVGAGVTNLISFTGTADIPDFIPDYFGGELWDRTDVYARHSAMFAVKNAKTPTLVIHGERDLRVPISQGQELYMALKRLGVKTQMVSYPRTPHGPQEPKFIQDIAERVIDWFNQHNRGRKAKHTDTN